MKIFYWSPFISKVATITAVINSMISLNKYSANKFEPQLINVAGEWDIYKEDLQKKNIKVINLTKLKFLKNKNYRGFIKSRFIYFLICLIAFFPLKNLLKKDKPEYLIIHLITPLPLILNYIFKFKTKFILRISGYPQLENSFVRLFFWKIFNQKLNYITCPTYETFKHIKSFNFINNRKIKVVYDPVLNLKEIIKKKNEKIEKIFFSKEFFVAIGRLTKQKNFEHLIRAFNKFNKNKKYQLFIIGEGENKKLLQNKIAQLNASEDIILLGYQKNVFNILKRSKCFILSSLWEDPGFVIIEAAFTNKLIISSDCKNGPEEILDHGNNGILYKSNDDNDLVNALNKLVKIDQVSKKKLLLNSKIKTRKYTLFSHYMQISDILT
jgi:glycosyltransferase involved in cell wall biosynthesis